LEASRITAALQQRLAITAELLRSLQALFRSSEAVEPEEFESFFLRVSEPYRSEVVGAFWARLEHAGKTSASANGGRPRKDDTRQELGPERSPHPETSVIVTYVLPAALGPLRPGTDASRLPFIGPVVRSAIQTPLSTLRTPSFGFSAGIVQESSSLFCYVGSAGTHPPAARQAQEGVVGVLCNLQQIASRARELSKANGVEIVLVDSSAHGLGRLPFASGQSSLRLSDLTQRRGPALGPKRFRLQVYESAWEGWCVPREDFWKTQGTNAHLVVLLLGVALSVLGASYVYIVVGRTEQVARLVEERTEELARANRQLTAEIAERRRIEEALRAAEQKALEASQAKGQFLARMSHEIRTPLHTIVTVGELLARAPVPPEQRVWITYLQQSSDALLELVNGILDFSRIEAGNVDFCPVRIHLASALLAWVRPLALRSAQKGLELILFAAPELPRVVVTDERHLRQVLHNLVGNAVKFTEKGHVVVHVATAGEPEASRALLTVRVEDTGPGVPSDQHAAIFEPFTQLDAFLKPDQRGTGLGLAIVRRLVEFLGGQVEFRSQVGEGTAVTVTIPVEVDQPGTPPKWELGHRFQRPALLASQPLWRTFLRDAFAGWGREAIILEQGPPPGGEGSSATDIDLLVAVWAPDSEPLIDRWIRHRALASRQKVPVVLLTSPMQPRVEWGQEQREAEVVELVRPTLIPELYEALCQLVSRQRGEPTQELPPRLFEEEPPRPLRILLVEDNPVNAEVVEQRLRGRGHQVVVVNGGLEALRLYEQQRFDVVLLDLELPEVHGLELARRYRRATVGYDGSCHGGMSAALLGSGNGRLFDEAHPSQGTFRSCGATRLGEGAPERGPDSFSDGAVRSDDPIKPVGRCGRCFATCGWKSEALRTGPECLLFRDAGPSGPNRSGSAEKRMG
jgi:two-component system sensor histidine kinase/response regulator